MTRSTIAAVRGAISVPADTPRHIRAATAQLLRALLAANRLTSTAIVSAIFTTTPDLESEYPAHAARDLGWSDVPLLGAREIQPPGALARVVRVLLTVHTSSVRRLRPVYLGEAARLRPDLAPPRATRSAKAWRIAIIGLGQIGGSIGLALAGSGWERRGFDLSRAVTRSALGAGAIDRASASLEVACRGADLALIAVPMDAIVDVIGRVARALPRGAVLIDTASARQALEPALQDARRRGVQALGGHPLAGSEGRGFRSARPDLFRGAVWCWSPSRGRAIPAPARALVRHLGALPQLVSAAAHDRALARTSHLLYLIARAVADQGAAAARAGLAGPSFRDFTRVAASDPRVAGAYVRANRAEVVRAWSGVRARLDREVARLEPQSGSRRPPRRTGPGR